MYHTVGRKLAFTLKDFMSWRRPCEYVIYLQNNHHYKESLEDKSGQSIALGYKPKLPAHKEAGNFVRVVR
jgi:hypothetical protein